MENTPKIDWKEFDYVFTVSEVDMPMQNAELSGAVSDILNYIKNQNESKKMQIIIYI